MLVCISQKGKKLYNKQEMIYHLKNQTSYYLSKEICRHICHRLLEKSYFRVKKRGARKLYPNDSVINYCLSHLDKSKHIYKVLHENEVETNENKIW